MRFLSNKEKRNLIKTLESILKVSISKLKKKNIIYDEENKLYIVDGIPIAFGYKDKILPTIFIILEIEADLPYIKVDKGAEKKILNGADVFRPGIIEFSEDIKKGDIVLILSEDNKLLGIGVSLMDYNEIKRVEKGKVIKNIHYYGDKITKIYKSLKK